MHNAYIAGLIDGEGSIMLLQGGPGRPRRPQVSISMIDPEPLEALAESAGGFVRVRKDGLIVWRLNGNAALELLTRIRPWLIIERRRRLADVLLKEYPRERGGTQGVRANKIERLFEKMHRLNNVRQFPPVIKTKPITDVRCAYLAGILDGEGHIRPTLVTEVWSTDPELPAWLSGVFGGGFYAGRKGHGAKRETWRWLRSPTGFTASAKTSAHMLIPRKKELVRATIDFSRTPPAPKPIDPAVRSRYEVLRAQGVRPYVAAREVGLPAHMVKRIEGQ